MSNSSDHGQEGQNFVLVDEEKNNKDDASSQANIDEVFENPLPEMPVLNCSNCGSELTGRFCSICGQPNKEVKRPLYALIAELLHVLLDLDGRAYRTVFFLFTRPAFLSQAYISGQRANYTAPLRLFLAISIIFFIFISAQNSFESFRESLNEVSELSSGAASESENEESDSENSAEPDADPDLDGIVTAGRDFSDFGDPSNYTDYADNDDFSAEDIEEAFVELEGISLPFLSEQANANLLVVLQQQATENYLEIREDPVGAVLSLLEYLTFFILLMVPILAFMQFVMFFLAKRYFIEHLILTLHNHTFVVLAFLVILLLGIVEDLDVPYLSAVIGVLITITIIWIPIYLLISLKRYFGWGWWITIPIYVVTSIAYTVVMFLGILALAILLFLLS